MTGVRARRVDGAEVKLDTASYRLRDRFFGSRVGRRALMAVALTFGRRGMALLEFQLRMRRLVGERVRSAAGSSEGPSNELYERVQRPVRSAYSTQKVRADPACLTSRSASQPAETIKKDRGRVRGGLPGRRRRVARCYVRVYPQLCARSRQPKSTAPFMRGPNSRVRQATDRCHQPRRSRSQQGISVVQRVPSANRSQERVGLF